MADNLKSLTDCAYKFTVDVEDVINTISEEIDDITDYYLLDSYGGYRMLNAIEVEDLARRLKNLIK